MVAKKEPNVIPPAQPALYDKLVQTIPGVGRKGVMTRPQKPPKNLGEFLGGFLWCPLLP